MGKSTYANQFKLGLMNLVIVMACAEVSECSGQSETPFKGANVMVFSTGESDSLAYKKLITTLIDAGYSIDVNNNEFFQLKTGKRPVACKGCDTYILNARVKNGDVLATALIDYNLGTFGAGTYEWTYSKSKLKKDFSVHEELVKVLSSLGTVRYMKQ